MDAKVIDNWYFVLELDFDPEEKDQRIIKDRIDDMCYKWTKYSNNIKYALLLSKIKKIRNDMGDEAERSKLANEARDYMREMIDPMIKIAGYDGFITCDKIAKIANSKDILTNIIEKRAVHLGIKITEDPESVYKKYYGTKPEGASYSKIKRELEAFSAIDSLYGFLYLDSPSEVDKAASKTCEELRRQAEVCKIKYNKMHEKNPSTSAGKILSVICINEVFCDEKSKEEYDKYLEYERLKKILYEIEIFENKSIYEKLANKYIYKITKIINNRDDAELLFMYHCKLNSIDYAKKNESHAVSEIDKKLCIREKYDKYLEYEHFKKIFTEIETFQDCKFDENDAKDYVDKISKVTKNKDEAELLFIYICEHNNIDYYLKKSKWFTTAILFKKKFVYGIDFGATNSRIAYVDESGNTVIIPNKLTKADTTPSVVLFENANKVVVGETAKGSAILDPENTFKFVKQSMGMKNVIYQHHGKEETPVSISSYILKEIANSAFEMTGYEIKDVVITCPAYFGTAETEATKAAGIAAGLNVMEIIREPTAAAIYYGCTKAERNQNILIYDLGGSTFDVTVMRIANGVIEEICKEGSKQLGGRNWDNEVMDYLWDTYCDETGYSGDRDSYAEQELIIQAEKLKWSLSEMDNAKTVLRIDKPKFISLSREVFEKRTEFLLNQTIELTDKVIKRAKEKGVEIDKILLVGGSTMMPQVKNILKKKYNIEPEVHEPNVVVTKGAAIYADEVCKDLIRETL